MAAKSEGKAKQAGNKGTETPQNQKYINAAGD